jgi:hypothetical protein
MKPGNRFLQHGANSSRVHTLKDKKSLRRFPSSYEEGFLIIVWLYLPASLFPEKTCLKHGDLSNLLHFLIILGGEDSNE